MITTATGAKKLESSDNWREIFPNSTLSTPGAHNASVDAADRIQAEVAPIINGKQCAVGAAEGEYVLLRNSTIAGKSDGAYKAAKAIPANTNIDSTYLGSPITSGISNDINSNLTNVNTETFTFDSGVSSIFSKTSGGVYTYNKLLIVNIVVKPTTSISVGEFRLANTKAPLYRISGVIVSAKDETQFGTFQLNNAGAIWCKITTALTSNVDYILSAVGIV